MNKKVDADKISKWKRLSTWIVVAGIVVFVLSFLLPILLDGEYLEEVGSLLAGSSFLIIFAGILLQSDELKLQRRESKLQREELSLQREQLEHQATELKETRVVFEKQTYLAEKSQIENMLFNLINTKDNVLNNLNYKGFEGISALSTMRVDIESDANNKDMLITAIQVFLDRINYIFLYINTSDLNKKDIERNIELVINQLSLSEKKAIRLLLKVIDNKDYKKGYEFLEDKVNSL